MAEDLVKDYHNPVVQVSQLGCKQFGSTVHQNAELIKFVTYTDGPFLIHNSRVEVEDRVRGWREAHWVGLRPVSVRRERMKPVIDAYDSGLLIVNCVMASH
ncbi:hypothetical protein AAC387_Pa10g2013 [Persea americana]